MGTIIIRLLVLGTDTMKIYASVLYVIDEDHYFISFTVYGRHRNHQIFVYIYSTV